MLARSRRLVATRFPSMRCTWYTSYCSAMCSPPASSSRCSVRAEVERKNPGMSYVLIGSVTPELARGEAHVVHQARPLLLGGNRLDALADQAVDATAAEAPGQLDGLRDTLAELLAPGGVPR